MNIKKLIIASAIIASTSISSAFAGEKYFGGGLALIDYSEDGVSGDASLTGIFGKFGTRFNDNFTGEVRFGVGSGDDSVKVFGFNADIELDSFFGAYLKAGIPATEKFYPYAVIGYTRGKLSLSAPAIGLSVSESEADISFGLGADFTLTEAVDISIEYMNYLDKDGAELSGFSLSVAKSF